MIRSASASFVRFAIVCLNGISGLHVQLVFRFVFGDVRCMYFALRKVVLYFTLTNKYHINSFIYKEP